MIVALTLERDTSTVHEIQWMQVDSEQYPWYVRKYVHWLFPSMNNLKYTFTMKFHVCRHTCYQVLLNCKNLSMIQATAAHYKWTVYHDRIDEHTCTH